MKRILTALAAICLICSCTKHDNGQGHAVFNIAVTDFVQDGTKSSVSSFSELPEAADATLKITGSDGAVVWNGKVSDWSEKEILFTGDYKVEAIAGTEDEEGIAKPCFKAEALFSVEGEKTTSVNLPMKLANTILRLECSEAFKKYFTGSTFTIKTGAGNDFPLEEGQALFVNAFRFTVEAELTTQQGQNRKFTRQYSEVAPATCYTIKFDAANVGGNIISISFDDSTDEIELGDIEINN